MMLTPYDTFSFAGSTHKKQKELDKHHTLNLMISIPPLLPLMEDSLLMWVAILIWLALVLLWTRRPKEPQQIPFQRASRFRPEAVPKRIDTIVIGSGPGACTCANLLAQSHYKVLMLEQHDVTGGGTHSFREHGCEWDTGLHYSSTAMSLKTARPGAIMDYMTKGKQQFRQFPEPYDEIFFPDGRSYPYMNGKEKTIDALVDDQELKQRVQTYMDIYTDVHRGFVALFLSRILPPCLQFLVRSRVNRYVLFRNVCPSFFLFVSTNDPRLIRLMQYGALTVRDVQNAVLTLGYSKEQLLAHCPKAPPGRDANDTIQRLKAILAHPIGDYGVQPRDASMAAHGVTAQHYINGGSYTVGPTQNISIHLTSVVRAYGGEVLVAATVRKILVENGRAVGVQVSNTTDMEKMGPAAPITEIRAKKVVCGTTAYNLYNNLLPQDLPVVQKFHDPNERTIRQSNGHLFVFCKISGDPDELPDHNLWYFNGDELDTAFDEFYANPAQVRPPIVYIGFPCTKDPTWKKRFPGVSNCIVISDG